MEVLKIAVFIPYHKKLTLYLDAVKEQFKGYDKIITMEADFTKTSETTIRNQGLEMLKDYDYVWTVDCDEFLLKEHQEKIIEKMRQTAYGVVFLPVIDYVCKDKAIKRREIHTPIVLCNPKTVKFYDGRCARFDAPIYFDYPIHHFGYYYPKNILKWKEDNYWNKDNPQEFKKYLSGDKVDAIIPDEIAIKLGALNVDG